MTLSGKSRILTCSIARLSQLLRSGQTTVTEVYGECLNRAAAVERTLSPFISIIDEQKQEQSIQRCQQNLDVGAPRSALEGVPFAVKDNFCLAGTPTTCGSNMLRDFVPHYTATVVQRLQDAGAIVLGKTNLDEFAMGNGTIDSVFGATRNVWRSGLPYTVERSKSNESVLVHPWPDGDWLVCGGSSGGSAVSVASGCVFAAISSDTGGSTRNPASYCGIVGLKPSYGLLSRHGLIPLVNSLDVPGIMARNVDDIATVLNIVAGPDENDSTTLQDDVEDVQLDKEPIVHGLRVGIPREYHCPGLSDEVVKAWKFAASLFEEAGAEVVQVSLPNTQYSIACYTVLNACEVASNMARYSGLLYGLRNEKEGARSTTSTEELFASTRHKGLSDVVRGRILAGNYFLLRSHYDDYFVQALRLQRLIYDDFRRVFGENEIQSHGCDVLLTPVTLTCAPTYSQFTAKDNRTNSAIEDYLTQPTNLAGLPAISLPISLNGDGLPIGLQLIGRFRHEQQLLNTAKWLQQQVDFPALELHLDKEVVADARSA